MRDNKEYISYVLPILFSVDSNLFICCLFLTSFFFLRCCLQSRGGKLLATQSVLWGVFTLVSGSAIGSPRFHRQRPPPCCTPSSPKASTYLSPTNIFLLLKFKLYFSYRPVRLFHASLLSGPRSSLHPSSSSSSFSFVFFLSLGITFYWLSIIRLCEFNLCV